VRTRFSTPTIGRKWMIGSEAIAATDIDPEGTVQVDGTPWRALINRATPAKAGDTLRVVGISRLLLEVAPLEGGAKDYREHD
jgi:membrane-bound serine protease (ClpP class)